MAKILGPAAPFPAPAPAGAGTSADAGTGGGDPGKPSAPTKKIDTKAPPGGASATKGDTETPPAGGARRAASGAGAVPKAATPATSAEAPAPAPPTPAPTSTITRKNSSDNDDAPAAQACPPGRRAVPFSEATSSAAAAPEKAAAAEKAASAAAAAAPKEREPVYRVEEVPRPSDNHGGGGSGGGGGGRGGKRAFVVTIKLPDLIEGDAEGRLEGPAGSQQAAGRAERDKESGKTNTDSNNGSGGGRRRTGKKAPSLSDFELDVLPTVLQLRIPGKYRLRLEMPCAVDDENVSAKFNKSRAVLKVSVQEK